MPEIRFKHFDEFRQEGPLKGVFLGGCVERGGRSSFRAKGHAHNGEGSHSGWICIRSRKRLMTRTGRPSELMLHELAHLLAPRQWHNSTFKRRLRELKIRFWKNEEVGR